MPSDDPKGAAPDPVLMTYEQLENHLLTLVRRPKITRGQALKAIRALMRKRLDKDEQFKMIWRPIPSADDRATALVLGAILENGLERAILSHCVEMPSPEQERLFGPPDEAPVTFDIKIRLSYGLGIIGETSRNDLVVLKQIRNLFAHYHGNISFFTPEIMDLCNNLNYIDKLIWGGLMGPKPIIAKEQYRQAIIHYYAYLATSEIGSSLRFISYAFPDLYA